jgi:scaffold protein salvador
MEFHAPPQVLVPANLYLYEEIPYWLEFYFRAAPEHDLKLRWELFRLPELDCCVNVFKRLYKQELETIVMNCAKLAYFRKNSHRFFWN